jgi:hypothetical protein
MGKRPGRFVADDRGRLRPGNATIPISSASLRFTEQVSDEAGGGVPWLMSRLISLSAAAIDSSYRKASRLGFAIRAVEPNLELG